MQVVMMKESAALLQWCSAFLCANASDYPRLHGLSLCYLWLCWFVELPLVQYVTVLNVFMGVYVSCLTVDHHDHSW
jgi:hypothetical protein